LGLQRLWGYLETVIGGKGFVLVEARPTDDDLYCGLVYQTAIVAT
jgi:hypothetical protein